MKNLFKNLMLVAVAAMAFTACQNDNEEVNKVDKVTVIEFTADLNATRSSFGEKGETGYKSVWNGGEKVEVYVGDVSANNNDTLTITTEDGVHGRFTAVFSGSLPTEGNIEAYVPAEGWADLWDNEVGANVMTPQIPGTQTPSDNSVDPAAHLLKSVQAYTGGVAASANLVFEHGVAYAKMTLNLGTVVAFENIESVVVDIDGNQRYTLLPTYLEDATFWFACKACEPTAMTVTITDKGDVTYVKELDLAAHAAEPLTFENGVVSTFTVGGFEKVVIEDVLQVSVENTFFFVELKEGVLMLDTNHFTWDANGFLEEKVYDEPTSDYGWNWIPGATIATRFDHDWHKITYAYIAIAHLDEGYEFNMLWSSDNVPAKYNYDEDSAVGFTYTGIISGIKNPPVPEAVAVTTDPESVSGRAISDPYDYTYYLSFVAGDWTITDLYFYAPVASNGIIPEGEHTIRGGTATLTDTPWAFNITYGGKLTVAYSGKNYVLTFAFEDANRSTYNFSFTGVIEGDNGIYQPGTATPLATPTNVAYELVDFTKARITWNAVDGAGSYELYYKYYDSEAGSDVESAKVTTNTNSYTFEDLTIGTWYTVYVKALPADETKNTASENYGSVYNVKVFADHNSMNATYTFNTVEKAGKNAFKFSDGVDNVVIAFPQELENVPAGTYFGGFESGMINPNDCSFNDSSISIDYVVVEGNYGESQTVTMVIGNPSIKAVFTGVLEEESNASTYVATSFQYQDDNNGSARLYKMVGDNFDINIWVNWHDDNNGTLSGDTLSYWGCPSEDQVEDYVYGDNLMWFCGTIDGAELSYNYDSTLAVSGNTVTLTVYDVNGSLLAVITAQL